MDLTIFTSAVGGADFTRPQECFSDVNYLAFVDRGPVAVPWNAVAYETPFSSARRNSRLPKILASQYVQSNISVWMDARVALKRDIKPLVRKVLEDVDIAVYRHPTRNCAYAEASECSRRGLDIPRIIESQVDYYRRSMLPENLGLAECNILFRRHSAAVDRFDRFWWAEYCRFSVRDQISFMFTVFKTGQDVLFIPTEERNDWFDLAPNIARQERYPD